MKIVICGAGQVGYGIAQQLAAEGHDLSIIDVSPHLIQAVHETIDARGILGNGAHPEVLAQAGAEDADMLIAATLHDEVNMVACQVAHSIFSVPTKIARIRSPSYLEARWQGLFASESIPIDAIISPEIEVGDMVLRRLALPGAIDVVRFAEDAVVLVGIECEEDCPILGLTLREVTARFPDLQATTVGIVRGGDLRVPTATSRLEAGDLAYVVADSLHMRRVLDVFGHAEPQAGRIIIAGGGAVGHYVARQIEKRGLANRLRIIEANAVRAGTIAESLERTIVLHGSSMDHLVLREADIDDADLLIALTNDDQTNILTSVMAKQLGCRSALTLINETSFQALSEPLGIDAFLSPRSITISRILQHVRRGRIRAVYSVQNGLGEVTEAEALETSAVVGQPLKDLDLPSNVRIGGIWREGLFLRPTGETEIAPGDRVVVFAAAGAVKEVERMFRVGLEYF